MIEDVYRLGLSLSSVEDSVIDEELKPDSTEKIDYSIIISISVNSGNYILEDISLVECNKENSEKFLLKEQSPRGPNYAPTAIITEVQKTFKIKIINWFKSVLGNKILNEKGEEIISAAYQMLINQKDKIEKQINDLMSSKKNHLLTVALNGELPLDNELIWKSYSTLIKMKHQSENEGTCSLCNKRNRKILPQSSVYKFFTIDKPGFISGGFDTQTAYRNFPVCLDCEITLKRGKEYINKNLQFSFCNIDYSIIPSTISGLNTLSTINSILNALRAKAFSFKEQSISEYKASAEDIWEILSMQHDINSFRIVFIKQEKRAERILSDIPEVFTARFNELYSAKKTVDSIYKSTEGGFNFWFIRTFLNKTDPNMKKSDLNTLFLSVVRSVFMKTRINQSIIIFHMMRVLRQDFENDENQLSFKYNTVKAWISLQFLTEVGCIIIKEGGIPMNEQFKGLYEKYGAGLDSGLKCALFLLGAVVKKVMNIQYKELKSTPFKNRLKGLKMRSGDVRGIISEATQKMMEYDSYSKASRTLIEEIFGLMLKTDPKWSMTVDEINFYISAGMSLYKEIYEACGETISVVDNEEGVYE